MISITRVISKNFSSLTDIASPVTKRVIVDNQDLLCSTLWMDTHFKNNNVLKLIQSLLIIDANEFQQKNENNSISSPPLWFNNIWKKCTDSEFTVHFSSFVLQLAPRILPFIPQNSKKNSQTQFLEKYYKYNLANADFATPKNSSKLIHFYWTPSQAISNKLQKRFPDCNQHLLHLSKDKEFWNEFGSSIERFRSFNCFKNGIIGEDMYQLFRNVLNKSAHLIRNFKEFPNAQKTQLWCLIKSILTTKVNYLFLHFRIIF